MVTTMPGRFEEDAELRRKAEAASPKMEEDIADRVATQPEEYRKLLHELQVHQIELQIQNEEMQRTQAELLESQTRYKSLYERSPAGYCTVTEKGLLTMANQSFSELLGCNRAELARQPLFSRFISRGSQEVYYLRRKLLLETAKPQSFEAEMVKHDGTAFWARLDLNLGQSHDGTPEIWASVSDNPEHKRNEDSLRDLSGRLSLAARAGNVGIWEYDVAIDRLVWDDQMYRLYGITAASFSGAYAAWQQGLHPDDKQRGDQAIQQALRGEKDFNIEFRVVWPDGSIRNIRGMALVEQDANGRPLRMIGTNWDITEQKKMEEKLRWDASLLEQLAHSSPLGFLVVDNRTDKILYSNHRFCEIWGITQLEDQIHRGELTNNQIIPACLPSLVDIPAFAESCKPLQDESNRIIIEDFILFTEERTVRRYSAQMRGDNDEYFGRFYIFEDVSIQARLEQKLKSSETNFRTFFESMTDMIMVGTPGGKMLFTNSTVTRKLGYNMDELKTMHILELHPRDRRQEAEGIFGAMFRGERDSCPLPLARKDGGLVPVETRVWFGQWDGQACVFGISKDLAAEQEARQLFERMFHNNPALMALSGIPDRKFSDVNEAFLETLGYSREEIIGKTAEELSLFPNHEQQSALADKLEKEGSIRSFELQVRHRDGRIFYGLFSGDLVSSQGSQFFLTVMVDITQRRRLEQDFIQAARQWRITFDSISEMIYIVDINQKITRVNMSFANKMGKHPKTLIGEHCFEVVHGTQRCSQFCLHATCMETRTLQTSEYYESNLGIFVSETVSPLIDDNNMVNGTIHILTDVTERKHAEAQTVKNATLQTQLVESKKAAEIIQANLAYETMISTMSAAFTVSKMTDSVINGAITDIRMYSKTGTAFLHIMDGSTAAQIGIDRWNTTMPLKSEYFLENRGILESDWWAQQIARKGYVHISDVSKLSKKGGLVKDILQNQGITALLVFPIMINGKVAGYYGLSDPLGENELSAAGISAIRVISQIISSAFERRVTADRLAQLVEELQELNAQLEEKVNERNAQLREALEVSISASTAKSDFLASMSHELRTPLTSIIGFSELLGKQYYGALNKKQTEYVSYISENSDHLLSLISDILDLSKIEARRMEMNKVEIDMSKLISNCVESTRSNPRGCKKIVISTAEIEGTVIKADERRVKQVILNLLANASKFTPENGTISVEATKVGRFMVIKVTDTGIGFNQEEKEHLFDEYFQAKHKIKYQGTGLGLPISRKIVETHGGEIDAESKGEGLGSCFSFTLPLDG